MERLVGIGFVRPTTERPVSGVCAFCKSRRVTFQDDGWSRCEDCGTWFRWRSAIGVWERLRAEVGSDSVDAERLRGLPYLDGVVSESLRLRPPGAVAGRRLRAPIEAAGLRVPGGVTALYSPYVTQRLPELRNCCI